MLLLRGVFVMFLCLTDARGALHKVGVSFSPAGLLTPYHLGVSQALSVSGLVSSASGLAGASGGSIAAVCAALEFDSEDILEACSRVAIACREKGTFRTLSGALLKELRELLPEDAASVIQKREGKCIVAYQTLWPKLEAVNKCDFSDKDDLIESVSASCTIPFYYSGSPFTTLRDGSRAVDGFFATQRSRFGCPATGSAYEIAVCPFDHEMVGLTAVDNVISPRLLQPCDWSLSTNDLLSLALAPPTDADKGSFLDDDGIRRVYHDLYRAGQESAAVFLATERLLA